MARHMSGGTIWAWQSIMGDITLVSRSSKPTVRRIVRNSGLPAFARNDNTESRPHAGRLDRHAACALHEEKLECHVFGRAGIIGLGPHPADAIAQAALQRAEALPFEAIDRGSGGLPLRHDIAGALLAPVDVVALPAGHVDLALPPFEQR